MPSAALYTGMEHRPTLIERAFALAKSGTLTTLTDLQSKLREEGYSDEGHLAGVSIRSQLRRLLGKAATTKQ